MMRRDEWRDLRRDWFFWACIVVVALNAANVAFVIWLLS